MVASSATVTAVSSAQAAANAERAADGAAVARLAIAGVLQRLADQRPRACDDRVVEQRLLPHEGADDELAVALLDRVEARPRG